MARKHNFSSDLMTASQANHPDQGRDSRGARTMSGRTQPTAPHRDPGRMGGAPARPAFTHKPGGKPSAARPNGGSFKPGYR